MLKISSQKHCNINIDLSLEKKKPVGRTVAKSLSCALLQHKRTQ